MSKTTFEEIRKAAAYGKGVTVIPFSDIRREATALANEVDRSKAASKYNYSLYERQKMNLLKEKEKIEKQIEDKKDEMEKFKRDHKESDVSSFEDDIKDLEDDLKDAHDKIDDINDELEDGAEEWKRLWNARGGLREVFDDALSEVKRAMSNQDEYLDDDASDRDKETLDKSLYVIEGMIEEEEEEHKKQEDGAKNTEQKFRDLIKVTST